MIGYQDALKRRIWFRDRSAERQQAPDGGLNLPPAQQRMNTALRMQPFYEPAFYGPQSSSWGDWSFSPMPSTVGGFSYRPLDAETMDVPDWARGALPDNTALIENFQARAPYDAPPVGAQNLANYGVGQLRRYGVGALRAYQPLAREEQLRYRP